MSILSSSSSFLIGFCDPRKYASSSSSSSSVIYCSFLTPLSLPHPKPNNKNKSKKLTQIFTHDIAVGIQAKAGYPISFSAQYMLSATSHSTSTPTASSDSLIVNRPWTYTGAIGPPTEGNYGAALATETLLTSEEAIIAAAAAEAVTLAKAAQMVAKDVALPVSNNHYAKVDNASAVSRGTNAFHINQNQAQHLETKPNMRIGDSMASETALMKDHFIQIAINECEDVELANEEFELLQEQLSNGIAARSRRQTERKARRTRAAEKAAASIVSVKSGRASLQDIDHSNPVELSEGIQELLKLEKLQEDLAQRCGTQPTFAKWAAAAGVDQKTLRKRVNYGILCKDKMIKSNIRLVMSVAKNYQGAGVDLQDLVQEGCRGLLRGAEKFDTSKGFKFSTYAHWTIKQAVRKRVSDQSRTIRLPYNLVEAIYRVREVKKQLYNVNGRHPNDEEVAEATGLSMKRLASVLLAPKAPRSLEQKIGINLNLKPSEVIADPDPETAEDLLMKKSMKQDLEKVLDTLNPREKKVIRWRFGMDDGRMRTLQEIGDLMGGYTRERIRQIESCAFRKLKNEKITKHLQQYVLS